METRGETATATGSALMESTPTSVLRVEDLERAKSFYRDTLGLRVSESRGPTAQAYVETGKGRFGLYERRGMPAPQNTTLGFQVEDFDRTHAEMRERGVAFEEYDLPEIGLKTKDGVAEFDGVKAAWFKDTEGNILVMADVW